MRSLKRTIQIYLVDLKANIIKLHKVDKRQICNNWLQQKPNFKVQFAEKSDQTLIKKNIVATNGHAANQKDDDEREKNIGESNEKKKKTTPHKQIHATKVIDVYQ